MCELELVQFFRSEKPAPTPQRPFISIANTASEGLRGMMRKNYDQHSGGKKISSGLLSIPEGCQGAEVSHLNISPFVYFPQIWSSSYQRELWTRGQASSAGEFSCSGTKC